MTEQPEPTYQDQEREALHHIERAAAWFAMCCELLDRGDLPRARNLLTEYLFSCLDAKASLPQAGQNPCNAFSHSAATARDLGLSKSGKHRCLAVANRPLATGNRCGIA